MPLADLDQTVRAITERVTQRLCVPVTETRDLGEPERFGEVVVRALVFSLLAMLLVGLVTWVLVGRRALVRIQLRQAAGGEARFPDPYRLEDEGQSIGQRGGVAPGSGQVRYYAALYRNATASFCPPASANVTNGVRVVW